MAGSKRLNYQIGFTADASNLQATISQAMQSLQQISTLHINQGMTDDIKNAAIAAQDLARFLTNATNVNTGKLDLSKFEASIQKSGISLSEYAAKLQAIGPVGEQAFLNVASAVAKAELPLTRSSALLDSLWVTMKNTMRWQLTSSMLRGFIGSVQTAYGYAQDLNESLNNIRIVTEKSAEDMTVFAERANKAAQILSTTTTDYTNASLIYYQQGLDDEQVQKRTEATIKFANVSSQNAETASEELTAIWNNFYDGSKSLEYYIDVMTALGATTASSSQEISEGVQKFAATASTIGLSYEYAAAALATVTATTRQSADIVGTAFKTLFARIQDLELGETLDDGTTLGSYSKALETVGVDIKTTTGELKGMDEILDDLGGKWGTLSKDTQVALAETVAGVRQYTQLIALMDNWDFFKENLNTAYTSEGTLNEQAEIYAESWEAARDRVTAAAENIYDSLVDEDFFISVDDKLAIFLNGVANSVDALGGMKGAVNLVGLALTSAFGDKIAASIRNMTYNFTVMTGKAEETQRKLKSEMGELALTMVANSSAMSTDQNIVSARIQAEDIQMQNQLNTVAKQLTEEQYKQLTNYKDIITQIKTMGLEYDKVVQERRNENETITQTITGLEEVKKNSIQYYNTLKSAASTLSSMPNMENLFSTNGKYSNSLNTLVQSYRELVSVGSQISTIGEQFRGLGVDVKDNDALVQKLRDRFSELTGITLEGNISNNLKQVQSAVELVDQALDMMFQRLQAAGVDPTILENLRVSSASLGQSMANSAQATDIATEETKKYMLAVYNATIQQKDWATMIVEGSNQLMRLGMMLQAIKSLGTVWSNDDLTTGEKIIQTLTSIGMILPTIISLAKLAVAGKVEFNTVTVEGVAAEEAEILSENAATVASGAHTKAKIVETKTIDGNTVAVVKNTTAWYANPIFWIVAAVTAAIAAFAVYNTIIEKNTQARKDNAKAEAESAQEIAESARTEKENTNQLYKEYIELKAKLDNSSEAKASLKEKTEELCEALGVEWNALDKLQDKYDEVNKEIAEANKAAALKGIQDTQTAIKATQNSMLENGSEYDSYYAKHDDLKDLTYKITFDAGFSGGDEQEISDYLYDILSGTDFSGLVMKSGTANQDFGFYVSSAEQFLEAYELLSQAYTEIQSDETFKDIRPTSEIYTSLGEWIKEYEEDYEEIIKLREDLVNYGQELAEAEAALTNQDIAAVTTLEDYEDLKQSYINNLKQIFEANDLIPDNVTDLDQYFEDLASAYLSGYENLSALEEKSQIAAAILDEVGDSYKDFVQGVLENDDYDIEILGRLDWKFITDQDNVEEALNQAYDEVKASIDAQTFAENISVVTGIVTDLTNNKSLDDDQLEFLEALEKEYGQLGVIRDKTSSQYIQALRDIREGMEHVVSTNAMDTLNKAWGELIYTVNGYKKAFKDIEDTEVSINIDAEDGDFVKNMKAIMDADYAVQVAIETDLQSDINDIISYADAVQEATSLIQEGFLVAYDDIDALTAVFPGILAGYTVTADGMIQLNSEIAQSSVDLAKSQIENDKEACRQNILDYQNVMLAKAAAMRTIAENLAVLMNTEITNEETTAEAKANIDSAMTDFKSACADEEALISEGLSTSEIDDSNQIMAANDNAAGTSANNWANAYNSMAENSAKWARIAITNANAVAKAIKGAQEGQVVTPEVATGGIFSSYSGGFEESEYSGVYESRGESGKEWYDYYSEYLNGDQDALQKAYEEAIKQAESYEKAAAIANSYLAKIDAAAGTVGNLTNTVGKGTGSGSGSDNTGTTYDAEDEKTLEDIEDRYHEINREIQDQESLLEDIDNTIDRTWGTDRLNAYQDAIEALTDQQDNYNAKLAEAQNYLIGDKANLQALFGNSIQFKENGEILNYNDVLQSIVDDYNNNFLADYNAFLATYSALSKDEQEARQAEYDSWQLAKTVADELYQKRLDALSQYEDTLDVIQEIEDSLEDVAREIEDNKLSQIEHRLEVVLTVKDMKDTVRDLTKEIVESFGDLLTHGIESTNLGWEQAQADMALLSEYQQTYSEYQDMLNNATDATDIDRIVGDLEELQGQAVDTAEALLSWIESIETLLPDAIDDASDRFSLFTDQLEHNESVLDTIKELYALQGVTYKSMEGFNQLQKVSQEKLEAQVAQAELQKTWYENARTALLEAEAALAGVEETDAAYDTLKNNRDALLEEYNEAQEAMLSSAQDAMETAQEMYLQAIEKAVYDFGQAVSGGVGLDLLQDKYDHYIEVEERYLDTVNEAYQVSAWYNKLQADIDKTTNSAMKEQLKALQEEIDIRRENNTLSEYDLEILEAKYKVLQAQMELEDAQNNKSELRLVRDRQGNWNYQYTADPTQVADAEQNLLDAENEWYNIAKQQVEDVTGEIISAWSECQSQIEEIYSDMTLTDQERADQAAEIYEYYTEKIKYLEDEKQIAIADMTEAGNKSLFDMAVVMGDEVTDLTGITSEDIQNIIAESGASVIELLTADNDTIRELVGSNTELIDMFDNVFAEDLANMTSNAANFETELSKTLEQAEEDFNNYQTTVQEVADQTGTSLDDLSIYIDNVSESTDRCRDAGIDAAQAMWEQLDAIRDLSEGYAELAQSVYDYIYALRDLAAEMASSVSSASGMYSSSSSGFDLNTDYSALMSSMIANGYSVDSAEYQEMLNQRNAKIDYLASQGYTSDYWGTYGNETYSLFSQYQNGLVDDWYESAQKIYEDIWEDLLKKNLSSYDTGGYTGEFNDAKLAWLHPKELVLNESDTQNILSAVAGIRALDTDVFSQIEKALDGNASAALSLMASKIGQPAVVGATTDVIEQKVTIERVEFPNVTSSDEIKAAFASIVDDASQWAKRRKS